MDLNILNRMIADAACPEAAAEEFERRYNCRMLPSYGMTETAATLTMADYDASLHVRAAGVGKPIDGVEVTLDPETGELAFSKTLEKHNEVVETYRPLWEAYDKKNQ